MPECLSPASIVCYNRYVLWWNDRVNAMTTDNSTSWDALLFGVQRSIRYHSRRQGFYDFWNTLTNAISIIFGAGTVLALLSTYRWSDELRVWLPALITVVATFNLVWGTSRMARLHNDLYRRFVALEKDMISSDEQAYTTFYANRLEIEADEPPVKFALDVLCHNELTRARGQKTFYDVNWWQRLWSHLYSFSGTDWDKRLRPNSAGSLVAD
jgi:hypothetical protein